jgi:hypothetical protein
MVTGWHRRHALSCGRSDTHGAEVRPQGHDDAGQRRLACVHVRVDDRAGLVGQRRRGPVVPEQRPAQVGCGVELVDGHTFDGDLAVQKAPMSSEVGAVRQPRRGLEDVDLQHIARTGAVDGDRAGQQMRARPPVGDAVENVRDARIHQQIRCIAGVVGQRLDGHQVPRGDGDGRLGTWIEVPPVHGRRGSRQPVDGRGCGGREHHPVIMPVGWCGVLPSTHTRQQIYYCQP